MTSMLAGLKVKKSYKIRVMKLDKECFGGEFRCCVRTGVKQRQALAISALLSRFSGLGYERKIG